VGLRQEAQLAGERAAKFRADYESSIREERKRVGFWMDEQRKRMADEERALIQKARDQANQEMQHKQKEIHAQFLKARADLLPLIPDYSSSIASKLLGHPVKVSLAGGLRTESGEAEQVF
jgi:F0F1-type ATP synthase membrane subunit b/b'